MGGAFHGVVLFVFYFVQPCADRYLVHLRHSGFQGKDPFLDLPFNQYHRDPEYRAFWQKKNGVFYMLNSIAFLILAFTPVTALIYVSSSASPSWETFFILSLRKLEP